ncbi:hypothetical protein K435DRAFT_645353, partial [Dendrothele bispora CBS 962.96]
MLLAQPLLSAILNDSSVASTNATSQCNDIDNCRTTSAILNSCFSVVFACTWVSMHPNIPRNFVNGPVVTLRNILLMFLALFTPELVILWAVKQWLAAGRISEKEYGWSKTQCFFVVMGGFALFEDGKFLETIVESNDWTLNEKEIAHKGIISITQDKIMEKSTGDSLSKIIVVGQTTWFIVQVIARGIEGFAITKLEMSTLAFAALNFVTYFLWWDKPQRV